MIKRKGMEILAVMSRLGIQLENLKLTGTQPIHYISVPKTSEVQLYEPLKYGLEGHDYHDADNIAEIAKVYLNMLSVENVKEHVMEEMGDVDEELLDLIAKKHIPTFRVFVKVRDEHWTEEKAIENANIIIQSCMRCNILSSCNDILKSIDNSEE